MTSEDKARIQDAQKLLADWILANHRSSVIGGLSKALRGLSPRPDVEEYVNHVLERCLYNEDLRCDLILGIEEQRNLGGRIWRIANNVGKEERRKLARHGERMASGRDDMDSLVAVISNPWNEEEPRNPRQGFVDRFAREFKKLESLQRRIIREKFRENRSFEAISKRIMKARQETTNRGQLTPLTATDVEKLFEQGMQQLVDRMQDLQP